MVMVMVMVIIGNDHYSMCIDITNLMVMSI